jgi:hypothetical protein
MFKHHVRFRKSHDHDNVIHCECPGIVYYCVCDNTAHQCPRHGTAGAALNISRIAPCKQRIASMLCYKPEEAMNSVRNIPFVKQTYIVSESLPGRLQFYCFVYHQATDHPPVSSWSRKRVGRGTSPEHYHPGIILGAAPYILVYNIHTCDTQVYTTYTYICVLQPP